MSPLEQIRSGILNMNMGQVKSGYESLTGTVLESAEILVQETTPEIKKKTTKKKATRKKTATKTTTKKSARKKTAVKHKDGFLVKDTAPDMSEGQARWSGNLFESMMGYTEKLTEAESAQLTDLVGKDGHKTRIRGDSYAPINIVCDSCKKNKRVNPAHIVPSAKYYYCDGCLDKRR
jgi:hypothetical protein